MAGVNANRKKVSNLQQKNRRVILGVLGIVFCMAGLAFASVPLYNLFCSVTGYGGTTQTAQTLPERISERIISVKFDAGTARSLNWEFTPEQHQIKTHPGEKTLVSYRAKNKARKTVAGTALYNVSPPKAGKYFHKIECFCFGEQILTPGQETSMPVVFFIDPSIDEDRNMNDVTTITLSYTFFEIESPELEQAMEDFYNETPDNDLTDKDSTAF